MYSVGCVDLFCFFNDTPTTEVYTYLHPLALHDALPIFDLGEEPLVDLSDVGHAGRLSPDENPVALLEGEVASLKDQLLRAMAETENVRRRAQRDREDSLDRKSTRLNSSH